MINFSIHNVTQVTKIRVHSSDHDVSGWVVLDMGAQNYFKDLELGLAQLRTKLEVGVSAFRKEAAEEAKKKEDEADGSD